ncbi:MAG: hypothetical protein OEM52_03315 [bacterium]|nr:hypothetical protein [bacterium]
MKTFSKILPYLLAAVMIGVFLTLMLRGYPYYSLPVYDSPEVEISRSFSPMHDHWKPGGTLGHGLGILGMLMMLSILVYYARKRVSWMKNWGPIRIWLQVHIFMGLCGPMLILFHSTGKVDGLVALSFWAMWGVVLSGIIGKWLYSQIPKSLAGSELSMQELMEEDRRLVGALRKELGLQHPIFDKIDAISSIPEGVQGADALTALKFIIQDDISRVRQIRELKQAIASEGIASEQAKRILALAKRKSLLVRKMRLLDTAQALFHWWHVFHKPLTYLMYGAAAIHVTVAIFLGYRWF